MTIYENLRQLRLRSGLTQEEVANRVGVTRQAISSYESGRTRPDIDMLKQFCAVYKTDMDGILYGEDRVLKAVRRIRCLSLWGGGIVVLLVLLGVILRWLAGCVYPIPSGLVLTEGEAAREILIRIHFGLLRGEELVGQLALLMTGLLSLVLLILHIGESRAISFKIRALWAGMLIAVVLLAPLPFAAQNGPYQLIDFYFVPARISARILLLFLLSAAVDLWKKHQSKTPEQEKRK